MKKVILILLALFCFQQNVLIAQLNSSGQKLTPGENFDQVFDRFGNKYNLDDLRIRPEAVTPKGGESLADYVVPAQLLCSSGIFNIYFEQGSGCEQNAFIDIDRRNVICQVFTDLSNFLVPADPNVKVNILVKNIENVASYPANTGILGLATSFYTVPANPGVSGILDGQVWKTINSGVDAYTNVASPLITKGTDASGAFYHGMMAFNFKNGSIVWHTDLTAATAPYTYDLYSTALHEMTHALGFASLINSAGGSNFGANYNYYSRYDLFLQDPFGNPLISPTTSCDLYEHSFNVPVSMLTPQHPLFINCLPDRTYCQDAIIFAGTIPEAVYSPNCFEPGSSLSHFEDECQYVNNQYYCMSNAAGEGSLYMTRYLKPEERSALCDLGYKVNTTYGNMLYVDNNYNYGGTQCSGLEIAGVNDGINTNGTYTWTTFTSGVVNINGIDLIGNDFNADEFECLEVVNGMGTVSVTNGNSSTSITFTAGTDNGIALLRYIPYNTMTGNKGNITYLYVSINTPNCIPTACNMIMNGGFEAGANCGQPGPSDFARIGCWQRLIETPDYLVRGCVPPSNSDKTVPTGTSISNPATDTWNGGVGNDAFMGLGFYGGTNEEAIQSRLSNPLQPGVSYTISFWAKSAASINFSGTNTLMFRSEVAGLAPLPAGSFPTTGQYLTEVEVKDDNEWNYYTLTFTYNGVAANHVLLVGNMGNTGGTDSYVFIDDFKLYPANDVARFLTNPALCQGETTIDDLSQFISPAMPAGATFSGPGVTLSGGIYSFVAPSNGKFIIYYNYTNASGCSISIPTQIYVTPSTRPNVFITSNPSPPIIGCGSSITLYGNGADTYDWYSPFSAGANIHCTGNCASIVVSPTAPGYMYVVIGTDSVGCRDTNEIYVTVDCGGGSYKMPDNVKHYTTKMIPGTSNESIMVGTIFGPTKNYVHFMKLDNAGGIVQSIEFPSTYNDERAVDLQYFINDKGDEVWYIICQARTGPTDIIKLLVVDRDGTLLAQREYTEGSGLDFYPMNGATWTDGAQENRLYICGYQPDFPLGGAMPDYNTPKHAFVMGIDINIYQPSYLDVVMSQGYDWSFPGTQDFDMATRMAVLNGSNNLWITGSMGGVAFQPWQIPNDRSATMNLVIDPMGAIISDKSFMANTYSDDGSGPLEYGIDLIQLDGGGNYILGNKGQVVPFVPGHHDNPRELYPRGNLIWWVQPVDASFSPIGPRAEFWNASTHWAAHAIPTGSHSFTVATLEKYQYANCIPLPFTPSYDNVQVNMIEVGVGGGPYNWTADPNVIYMTSSGTGNPFGAPPDPNTFYLLGDELSVIDYPPTFAARGGLSYVVNAPKYNQNTQRLNLKILTPSLNTLYVGCGNWDINDPSNCVQSYIDTPFIEDPIMQVSRALSTIPVMGISNPSMNISSPYSLAGPDYECYDINGNPTYRYIAPSNPVLLPTKTIEKEKLAIYPNPATSSFFIDIGLKEKRVYNIEIYDITGRKVFDEQLTGANQPKFEINTSAFADGTYLVKVYTDDRITISETQKVLIMKNK